MLIIEITKLELTGGIIKNILIIEPSKSELTTAILDYTKYRDCLTRINWRPYWIYCIYIDYQNKINRRPY